jgi:uncharacterized protein
VRAPRDLPNRRPRSTRRRIGNRGRVALIAVACVLLAIVLMGSGIARFYTDYLWYDALGRTDVFTRILGSQIALAAIFTGIFFVLAFVNLAVADRMRPELREIEGPDGEFLARYQELVGRRSLLVRAGVALVFAIIAGSGTSSRWRDWLLFTNAVDFGTRDALFGWDDGFYVFRLPFLSFVVDWLFSALVIIFVIVAVAHYLNGSVRLQVERGQQRFTPQVKAHLSVLLGALALVRAVDYYLQRFELTVSSRGFVEGAGFTDVEARLPAINLLGVISVFAFLLLIWNIRRRGWALPAIAVGLWAVVAFVANTMYPAFVQRFQVQPAESQREAPYIERNIAATQTAMGLDAVTSAQFPAEATEADDIAASEASLRTATVIDPDQVRGTYNQFQSKNDYFVFPDLDVVPYDVNGEQVPFIVGARELSQSRIPNRAWEGQFLAYTHGYGVAMAPANRAGNNGLPAYSLSELPIQGTPEITQAEIYFGEQQANYAVVNTRRAEISFSDPRTGEDVTTQYQGEGGVGLGSTLRQIAFAVRFQNVNMLLSDLVTGDSRIIYQRNVRDRVETIAPFLRFDSNPYPVVVEGRIKWIIDGYTTTDRYPYAQRFDRSQDQVPDASSGLGSGGFNYVRNPVKAVVDAYDGEVTLYVTDDTEPLIRSYVSAFPELFTLVSEAPESIRSHFRYPEDLFRVQTTMWARWHQSPAQFYTNQARWSVSPDPGDTQQGGAQTTTTDQFGTTVQSGSVERIAPIYQQMQLPGEEESSFVISRSFVPFGGSGDGQRTLRGFMAGEVNSNGQLMLREYTTPGSSAGPDLAQQQIQNDPDISRELTLLDQAGTSVHFGAMQLITAGDTVVYIRPVYTARGSTGSTGEDFRSLSRVAVATSRGAAMANTLEEALVAAFPSLSDQLDLPASGSDDGASVTPPDEDGSAPTTTTPPLSGDETTAELLEQATELLEEAENLPVSELGRYQELIEQATALIQQAARNEGVDTADTTVPATSAASTTSTTSA